MTETGQSRTSESTPVPEDALPTTDEARPYRRLPGRGKRLSMGIVSTEIQRLYLGADHLLVIRTNRMEETHKKFYFGDIQAITVQSNSERMIIGVGLTVLMMASALFGWLLASAPDLFSPSVTLMIWFSLLGVPFLLWNFFRGPRCTVRLHTAVQIEELTALRRIRTARKCLAILTPLIQSEQGPWPEDRPSPESITELSIHASADAVQKRTNTKAKRKTIGRTVHAIAFLVTVVSGLSAMSYVLYVHSLKSVLDSLLALATIIMLVTAAIRQVNSSIPRQTQILVWVAIIGNGVFAMTFMQIDTFLQIDFSSSEMYQNPFLYSRVANAIDYPGWFRGLIGASGVVNLILGALGLASLRGYRIVERVPVEAEPEMNSPES